MTITHRHSHEEMSEAIEKIAAGGGTPLKDAINAGASMLSAQAKAQLGYGEYHLVIVTDGAPGPGQNPTRAIHQITNHTAINVHTIGFCLGTDHPLNNPGRTTYYAAEDEQSLRSGLSAVLSEAPSFDVTDFKGDGNG